MYFSMKAAGVALLVASQVAAAPVKQPWAGLPKSQGIKAYLGIGPAVYPDSGFKQSGHGKRDEETTGQLQARKIPVHGLGPAKPVNFEPVDPETGRSLHRKPKGDLPPGSKPFRLQMGPGPSKGGTAKPVILPRGHHGETVTMPAPHHGSKIDPKMIAASPIPVRRGGKHVTLSRRDVAAADEEADESALDEEANESAADEEPEVLESRSIGRQMEAPYIPAENGGSSHLRLPRSGSPESAADEEADEDATELQARGLVDTAAMIRASYIPVKNGKHSRPILPRSDVPAAEEEADEEATELQAGMSKRYVAMIGGTHIPAMKGRHGRHSRPILPRGDVPADEEAEEEANELQAREPRMHHRPLLPGRGPILPRSDVDATAE